MSQTACSVLLTLKITKVSPAFRLQTLVTFLESDGVDVEILNNMGKLIEERYNADISKHISERNPLILKISLSGEERPATLFWNFSTLQSLLEGAVMQASM